MTDEQPVARRFRHDECANLGKGCRATSKCSGSGAARFFAGRDEQHDTGCSRQPAGQLIAGRYKSGDAAFHIGRAAAIEPAISDLGGQRIDGPGLDAERHGIEMPGKSDRRFPARAANARDQLRASFAERGEVDGKARTFEQGRQPLGASAFVARRIDRSEADKVLRKFYGRRHGSPKVSVPHILAGCKFSRRSAGGDATL